MNPPEDEFTFIARLRAAARFRSPVVVGIGDDTAVLRPPDRDLLITKDVLAEGVHFDLSVCPPQAAGRKALAVNLSDIAAMGGRPTVALVGLVLPRGRGVSFAAALMHGLQELADEFDVSLAGGDTNTWHGPCVVSVTLLGEVTGAGPVLRSGAQPGDWLMVSGALGGSLQGRHLWFEPRVRLAAQLQERVALHAMIDVSDGLGRDLRHVLRESRVGAVIDADRIPIHEDVDTSLPATDRLQQALADGEDFELLFAVTPADGQLLLEDRSLAAPVTRIGVVTAELDCRLREADGRVVPLPVAGWVHPF